MTFVSIFDTTKTAKKDQIVASRKRLLNALKRDFRIKVTRVKT